MEHLGRGTAMAVDRLVVVVEPGRRSIETALQIHQLAGDIGIKKFSFVGNKIRSDKDKAFLVKQVPNVQFMGFIPYRSDIIEADLDGRPPFEKDRETLKVVKEMLKELTR